MNERVAKLEDMKYSGVMAGWDGVRSTSARGGEGSPKTTEHN